MSRRGRGQCPNCEAEYFNRSKPKNCTMCNFHIGGTFESDSKKAKICPAAVEVCLGTFSVMSSLRDDRCFVSRSGDLWFCSSEKCKVERGVLCNSSALASFSCKHVKEAKKCQNHPLAVLFPNVERLPCSESMKEELRVIIQTNSDRNPAVQVSSSTFVVVGEATASNPLGLYHVRQKGSMGDSFLCSGKECRGFSSKGKQHKTKSKCHHVLLLRSCFDFTQEGNKQSSSSDDVPVNESVVSETASASGSNTKAQIRRDSTITLAEKIKTLPYDIPKTILEVITSKNLTSWPDEFVPDMEFCLLCGSDLGEPTLHPGQHTHDRNYLITEMNPFKRVSVKVKFCSSEQCLAMHQPPVERIGLFNISDKVLVSLDIMVELREFFKRGLPISNVISAKLAALKIKCKENDIPDDSVVEYVEDLMYKGFFCFEAITERNLDDVVCGVCGICPEVCLGDGNEKNCCTNKQIHYTKKEENPKEMFSLSEMLLVLKRRWLERTVYTRNKEEFTVAIEQLPPIMPPSMAGENICNTELMKKSVYLESNNNTAKIINYGRSATTT